MSKGILEISAKAAPAPRPSGSTTAAGPRLSGATGAPRSERRGSLRWVGLTILALLAASALGGSYYFAPMAERVRSPLHPWLKPSGVVGQSAGIVALLIFLFLWLYPLRKKFRWLSFTGSMAQWMDVHVAVALILPFLAAVHASWRFDGVIGLGYLSMLVVCASGIVGRYLYIHIPRSASGLELSAEEIAAQRRGLVARIAEASRIPAAQVEALLRSDPTPCEGLGLGQTLTRMFTDDLARWRSAHALRRLIRRQGGRRVDRRTLRQVLKLAHREMSLTQQARMLNATQRLFRFWHVAHRPFAVTALVAVLIHVGVVVAMGATWFW